MKCMLPQPDTLCKVVLYYISKVNIRGRELYIGSFINFDFTTDLHSDAY